VVGTKSKSDEESRDSVGMQLFHTRISLVIIKDIEDGIIKFLMGYWAVPGVNREMIIR